MKMCWWLNAATRRVVRLLQHAVAEDVTGHVADAGDGERLLLHVDAEVAEVMAMHSHAPRAVMPSFLWS